MKHQLEKERNLRLQHKNFFVGWSYFRRGQSFTRGQEEDATFTITRMTPKCIYYTKTENGVESEPKRKLIKITGDENVFGGIQYFHDNRKYEIMATYNM